MNTLCLVLAAGDTGSDGLSVWEVVVVVLTVVGGIAAIQQIAAALTGRRERRAQKRLLEAVADRYDAEVEEQRLHDLKGLTEELESQIRTEIPRFARQSYLTEQRRHLERSLLTTYQQLVDVETELADRSAETLDPAIRHSIEDRIGQVGTGRASRDRSLLLWLIALVVVTSVVPYLFNLGALFSVHALFGWIFLSEEYPPAAVVFRSVVFVTVVCLLVVAVGRTDVAHRLIRRWGTDRVLRAGLMILAVGLVLLVATGLYAKREDDAARTERAKDLPTTVLVDDPRSKGLPEGESVPQVVIDNPKINFGRYDYNNNGVGGLLLSGLIVTSLGLSLCILGSNRRSGASVADRSA